MLSTLTAIKKVLLTKNIYKGNIYFLANKKSKKLNEVYVRSSQILENKEITKEILFKTGESPFYVRELLTGKKIPVIYLERPKVCELPYSRNPKFNIDYKNLPDYCIIFDKWINDFEGCLNIANYDLKNVYKILSIYEKENNILDEIIKECLYYTKNINDQIEKIEKEENENKLAKKVLIESYLRKTK